MTSRDPGSLVAALQDLQRRYQVAMESSAVEVVTFNAAAPLSGTKLSKRAVAEPGPGEVQVGGTPRVTARANHGARPQSGGPYTVFHGVHTVCHCHYPTVQDGCSGRHVGLGHAPGMHMAVDACPLVAPRATVLYPPPSPQPTCCTTPL